MRALAVKWGIVLVAGVVSAQNPATFSSTNLSSVTTVATGAFNSRAVEVGDFTGDGIDDVLVAHSIAPEDLVLLANNGSGDFSAGSLGVVPGIVQVVSGRFNADSLLDIAWIEGSLGNIGVRLGTGNGTFGATTSITLGATLSSIAAFDLDADAKADLAVTNSATNTVTILKGDGLGGFSVLTTLPCGPNPSSLRIANFNGDNRRDLAVACVGTSKITLILNTPGGFLAPTTINTSGTVNALEIGDLDADQHVDIVVCTPTDVAVLFGDGAGAFPIQRNYVTGQSQSRASVFDATGDGLLDIVCDDSTAGRITVLANLGSAAFAPQRAIAVGNGQSDMAYGRLDGDNFFDLALVSSDSPAIVWILRGPLQPVFDVATLAANFAYPRELHADDIDLDGDVDLVATATNFGFLLYRNNGLGLTPPVTIPGNSQTQTLGIGDFDNDGRPDVLEASWDGTGEIQLGQANGGFTLGTTGIRIGRSPEHLVVADFNHDGNADFAASNNNHGNISVRLGDGTGGFSPWVEYPTGYGPNDLVAADIDSDGNTDLVVATSSSISVGIVWFRGDGNGGFTPMGVLSSQNSKSLEGADIDADGDIDLVANSSNGEALVLLGNGNATFASVVVPSAGGNSWGITIADLDRDGDLDIATANWALDSAGLIEQVAPGVFRLAGRVTAGHNPIGIAAADFDRDGSTDLAVANFYGFSLSVLDHSGPACPDIATYCTAKTNSLGCVPELAVSGLPSVSAPQMCGIQASQELSHAPGTLFYGAATLALPFHGGFKCVASPLRRTPLQNAGGTPGQTDCSGSYSFDLNAWIRSGNDPSLSAGSIVYCQFWSRDSASPSPFNLTAAVHLVVCP